MTIWLLLLSHIFIIDVGRKVSDYAPELSFLFEYRLLLVLAIIAALWGILGNRLFFRWIIYAAAYPGVLIAWTAPKLLFRNWPIIIAFSPAIYQLAKGFKSSFILATIALVSGFSIFLAPATEVFLAPAMLALGAYLALHYIRRLSVAYSSSTFFGVLTRNLQKAWDGFREAMARRLPEIDPESATYKQRLGEILLQAYILTAGLHFLGAKFREVVESRMLDLYFIGSLLWTFLLTVISFAALYVGLYRLDPDNFYGVEDPRFIDFIGYSFSTLMTSSISPMTAASALAQGLSYLQLFGSLLIIVLLVFIILTSNRERHRQDLDKLVDELEEAEERTAEHIKENFDLTLHALERRLIKENKHAMMLFLRLRYGDEEAERVAQRAEEEPSEDGMPSTAVSLPPPETSSKDQ